MDKLRNIIEKLIGDDIVLIALTESQESGFIKVVVDSEKSIDAKTTTKLACIIKESPELVKRYPQGFQLEVTSPGITSPLLYPFQYKKNIGRKLTVSLNDPSEKKRISGTLTRVGDDGIDLSDKKRNTFSMRFEDIKQAVVKITFK